MEDKNLEILIKEIREIGQKFESKVEYIENNLRNLNYQLYELNKGLVKRN